MAAGMFGLGAWEMLIFVFFGFGSGSLPLGIPPAAEDPLLQKVAPEDCTFYVSWAGTAKPDAASKNHTEQLLAEKEIQIFAAQVEKAIGAALLSEARDNEGRKVIAVEAPRLVKALLTKPTAAFIGDVVLGERGPAVQGGLVVSTGDDTAGLMASLANLEAAIGDLNEVEIGEQKWKEFPVPDGAPRLVWGFKGKYFILGVGDGAVEAILKRARGEAPKWLTAVRARNKVPRFASMSYLNVKKLVGLPTKFGAPPRVSEYIKALGLDNVSHLASVTGLDDEACVTRSHIAIDGQAEGLFKLLAGRPLEASDLAPIPQDASLAAAIRFDPADAMALVKGLVAIDPNTQPFFDGILGQAETQIGVTLEELFKAVGDTWRVYNSPGEGGVIVTGLTAVVNVRDRDTLVKTSDKIQEMVARLNEGATEPDEFGRRPRHFAVKRFEHNKHTVYFFNFVGDEVPVSPAWCITDKEFIISLYPSHVKSYLDRTSQFKPITSVKAVADTLVGDKPPTMLAYHDTQHIARLAYPLVQGLACVLVGELQRQGVDVDMSAFPSAGAILPHLRPGISTLSPTKDGIEMTTRQTLPAAIGVWQVLPMMVFGVGSARMVPRGAPGDFDFDFDAEVAPGFRAIPGGGGDGIRGGGALFDLRATLKAVHRHALAK